MKKFLLSLAVAFLAVFAFVTKANAADYGEFGKAFLKDGKVEAPEGIFAFHENPSDESDEVALYVYHNNAIKKLTEEYDYLGETEFEKKYGCHLDSIRVQNDFKVDDGSWLYVPAWDEFNFEASDINSWIYEFEFDVNYNAKVVEHQNYIDLEFLNDDGTEWSVFSKDFIKVKNSGDTKIKKFDVSDHTFYFRSRYCVEITGDFGNVLLFSDWTDTVSFGKKGSQKTPQKPDRFEAPVLSDMKYNNEHHDFDVFWTIPDQVYDAVTYYTTVDYHFEPIYIETQYRVNDGEWHNHTIGNAATIYGGIRGVGAPEAQMDDKVEIRARFVNRADKSRAGKWSNYVCNKAGYVQTEDPNKDDKGDGYSNGNGGGILDGLLPTGTPDLSEIKDNILGLFKKSGCKLCGVCPVQPLKICLFIWILVVLLLVIVIMILIRKAQKKKGKKGGKLVLSIIIAIIIWILILVLFIWLCKKNKQSGNNGGTNNTPTAAASDNNGNSGKKGKLDEKVQQGLKKFNIDADKLGVNYFAATYTESNTSDGFIFYTKDTLSTNFRDQLLKMVNYLESISDDKRTYDPLSNYTKDYDKNKIGDDIATVTVFYIFNGHKYKATLYVNTNKLQKEYEGKKYDGVSITFYSMEK